MTPKKIICVLGMHRSGTSVVSKMLSLLGAYLGPEHRAMVPTADNPKGYWEHTGFVDINDEILARFGGAWDNPPEFPDGWASLSHLGDLRQRARDIISEDFGSAPIWSWKDPRTCLTIPFWQQLLPSMQYVVCVRDPVSVARSLERRDGFSIEKAGQLWLSHTASSLRSTSGRPRLLIFYEDFMEDCESGLSRLAAFLDVRLEPRVLEEARAFVDQKLYHHRPSLTGSVDEPSMAFPAKSLYLALRAGFSSAAAGGGSELDAAIDIYGALALEEDAARRRDMRRTAVLREELAETREHTQALTFEGKALRDRLRGTDTELTTVASDRAAMQDDLAHQRHTLQEEIVEHEMIVAELRGRIFEETERRVHAESRGEQLAGRAESAMRMASSAQNGLRAVRAEMSREETGPLASVGRFVRRWTATARALGALPPPASPGAYKALFQLLAQPRRFREAALITASGVFDEVFYLRRYPDLVSSRMRPLMHFVLHGAIEGRQPHALFDTARYLSLAPDVAASRANALAHFLKHGVRERRDPHALFSSEFYLAGLGGTAPLSGSAFLDYLTCGSHELRAPHALFDPLYYLEHNPDVARSGMHPLVHFMTYGAFEGRSPHSLFDLRFYLDHNRDVAASGVNPLLHYLFSGAYEGRNPHPLFDVSYYLTTFPDVQRAKLEPLTHFLTVGAAQGRNPNPSFDCAYYASQVPEVAAGLVNPLVHFVREGWQTGLNPSKDFDTSSYLREHADVRQWGGNPLVHYLYYGRGESRATRMVGAPRSEAATSPAHRIGEAASAAKGAIRGAAPLRICHRFAVYTSSLGNYFFGEITDLLATGLQDLGFVVEKRDERQGFSTDADWHIVVAPHEFFYLGFGQDLLRKGTPRQLILLNTEQPSTPWFSLALACFSRAYAVWDISFESSRLISGKGYRSAYLALGYSPRFEAAEEVLILPDHRGTTFLEPEARKFAASRRPRGERPIDVLFVGHISTRRDQFFAKASSILSRYRCYLHFSTAAEPVVPGRTTFMNTATVMGLAQRTKILLNIHHGADRYFEWHRIVIEGIWQRTLVVSEPCGAAPPFKPGIDFVEAPLDEMPDAIEYFLSNPDGRVAADRIVEQGFRTLTEDCRLTASLRQLILDLHNVPEFPSEFREAGEAPAAERPVEPRGVTREEHAELAATVRNAGPARVD